MFLAQAPLQADSSPSQPQPENPHHTGFAPPVEEDDEDLTRRNVVVRVFFNGSPTSAASALLGMSEKLDDKELDALEKLIAEARKAKGE